MMAAGRARWKHRAVAAVAGALVVFLGSAFGGGFSQSLAQDLPGPTPMIVREAANLRTGPSVAAPRCAVLYPGERVLATAHTPQWMAVSRPVSETKAPRLLGYVHVSLLEQQEIPAAAGVPGGVAKSAAPDASVGPTLGKALGLKTTPSIETRVGFDENIQFKDVSGWEFLVSPGLALAKSVDQGTVGFKAKVDNYSYAGNGQFDHIDQKYTLDLLYNLTKRLDVHADGSVRFDNSFQSILEETGSVVEKQQRYVVDSGAGLNWRASERATLDLSVDAQAVRTASDPESERSVLELRSGWKHSLRPDLAALARVGGGRFEYSKGRQRVYWGMGGGSWKATETIALEVLAGGAFSQASFVGENGSAEGRNKSLMADVSLKWSGERNRIATALSTGPAAGGSENSRQQTARVRFEHDLAEHWTAWLTSSVVKSDTSGYVEHKRSRLVGTGLGLGYRLSEYADIYARYDRLRTKDRATDLEMERNQFFLGLSRAFPAQ